MYKDRHAKVDNVCEVCGITFSARVERVNKGQGRFCSKRCSNENQRIEASQKWGFENGKTYWDGKRYIVRWYDDTGNHSTSYANWWWNMNIGEVPDGYVVSYVDENYENISPNNFELTLKADISRDNGSKSDTTSYGFLGKTHSQESKTKMSEIRTGKPLSDSHKENIGKATRKRWEQGDFDNTVFYDISGNKNPNWRGGVGQEYPPEFNRSLKKFIWDRDNSTCQICGDHVSRRGTVGHVHHIDGHKNHNDYDNLVLLCIHCHAKIHHGEEKSSPVIMAFRSKLHWNS